MTYDPTGHGLPDEGLGASEASGEARPYPSMTETESKVIDGYEKTEADDEVVHRFPGPISGDTVKGRAPNGRFQAAASEADRFWSRVAIDQASGCWTWTARTNPDGYGVFKVRRPAGGWTEARAHRWAFEQLRGQTPLPLDHLCHTTDPACPGGPTCPHRRCVNPAHLEEVSSRENRRRVNDRRTA